MTLSGPGSRPRYGFSRPVSATRSPAPSRLRCSTICLTVRLEASAPLDWQPISPPLFFRTDQAADGTVLEVQCPGSLSGVHEIVHAYYFEAGLTEPERTSHCRRSLPRPYARIWAVAPVIHHLLDNSSHPAGERFFIQRVRPGAAYFGFDEDVRPQDCNFVRAHDFFALLTENFAAERWGVSRCNVCLRSSARRALRPKAALAFPFWDETRRYFTTIAVACFPIRQSSPRRGVEAETGTGRRSSSSRRSPPASEGTSSNMPEPTLPELGQSRRFSSRYRHE